MKKNIFAIATIFTLHAFGFALMYYGRVRHITLLHSDVVLFLVPGLTVVAAYAWFYLKLMIKLKKPMALTAAILAALLTTGASLLVGMTIAFNRWGT
jgi:hypothetical protein